MTRLAAALVANLDCEVRWTAGPPLPPAVVTRLARLGTTLRALAPAGLTLDQVGLWLPQPVPQAAVVVDAVGCPRLMAGPWPAAERVLPWGALDELAGVDDAPAATVPAAPVPPATAWRDALWSLPPTPVAVARAVSDRRWAAARAVDLGVGLSGSRTLGSVDELRDHLAAGGADASPTGAWVVKAPVTAAGRERVKRIGATLDPAIATRLDRLFARHGALVFEPWLERVLDLGQPGVVLSAERHLLLPPHRSWCDQAGVVRGLLVDDGAALTATWRAELARVGQAVASALGRAGYRGAFVIDAMVHRVGGALRLHPLGEVNPRLTFGLVARAWAERTGARALGLGGPPPPGGRALVVDDRGVPAAWLADDLPAEVRDLPGA